MKVILSRKGFDSSAGGYPSPHFIETGRLLSLPIPSDGPRHPTYAELRFDRNRSYLEIMDELGLPGFHGKTVHLDPDVCRDVVHREEGWRGLFGQCRSAQTHLGNQGVEPGDLFLFFGWFRDVQHTNGGYRYLPHTDRHIIWGYLQVGEIESISRDGLYESWKENHPHYAGRDRKHNTAYIAADQLSFSDQLPGYGLFNYHPSRVLTAEAGKRSVWRLPKCLHPSFGTTVSCHENPELWSIHDDHCRLQSVPRGQEFVIQGNSPAILEWVNELFVLR